MPPSIVTLPGTRHSLAHRVRPAQQVRKAPPARQALEAVAFHLGDRKILVSSTPISRLHTDPAQWCETVRMSTIVM